MPRQIKWRAAITANAARNIIQAVIFSDRIAPFSHFLTIRNITEVHDRPQRTITTLLKYIGDWLRFHAASPLRAVWALESPAGIQHVHIVLHVPEALTRRFTKRLRGWLKLAGIPRRAGTVRSKPVGDLKDRLGYILKGTEERACRALRNELLITHIPQGYVIGKRCGTSQAIGAAARRGTAPTARGLAVA